MTATSSTRRRLTAAALALPVAGLPGAASALAQGTRRRGIVGDMAPEPPVEFWIDAAGRPTGFRLLEMRGKWVHLKFWQNWCPGCHARGFPALKKMIEAFRGEPRVVNAAVQTSFEGYAFNDAGKVRQTQLRYDLPIVMGHESGEGKLDGLPVTMRLFRSGGTPWHVLIDPRGIVVHDGFDLDADGAIAHIRQRLEARPP